MNWLEIVNVLHLGLGSYTVVFRKNRDQQVLIKSNEKRISVEDSTDIADVTEDTLSFTDQEPVEYSKVFMLPRWTDDSVIGVAFIKKPSGVQGE